MARKHEAARRVQPISQRGPMTLPWLMPPQQRRSCSSEHGDAGTRLSG
ncbi:Hypothetical protein A7982_01545 [Minicystis rosea]|nr:Hypothetical protein A7982_01545 [Minicystis rosea]